jgi:2,4-dienoyl-CoA reductase-like NADH-dependent reductase (Old Yellow Enzyme family)
MRFLKIIRRIAPPSARTSSSACNSRATSTPHGLTLADTTVDEIETSTSIDYITVKAGTFYSSNNIVPDMQHPFGVFLPLASGIRHAVTRVPIFAVGRITDPLLAERVLAEGIADMVAMTRAHISDPEVVKKAGKVASRTSANASAAIRAASIPSSADSSAASTTRRLGRSRIRHWHVEACDDSKKVVVVGGGPAGMKGPKSRLGAVTT